MSTGRKILIALLVLLASVGDVILLSLAGMGDAGRGQGWLWFMAGHAVYLILTLTGLAVLYRWLKATYFKPMAELGTSIDALAGGALDTFIPHIDADGDVGRLARAAYRFKQETRENNRLHAEQEAYRASLRRQQQVLLLALANRFETQIGDITKALVAGAEEMNAAAEMVSTRAASASENAARAHDSAGLSREDVDLVSQGGGRILETAQQMTGRIDTIVARVGVVAHSVSEAAPRFKRLKSASNDITSVVSLISDIAEQTNLLALNAAMEAQRAGRAGAGFAVVANEVRSLARQTADAAGRIGQHIAHMVAEIDESARAIEAIDASTGAANQAARDISQAAHSQSTVAREVDGSIQEAAERLGGVLRGIGEISRIIGETAESAAAVQTAAAGIREKGKVLEEETDQFLIQIRDESHLGDRDEGEIELF